MRLPTTRYFPNFIPIDTPANPLSSSAWQAQFCADINSGFRVLVNEVTRAEYLLKRAGVDLQAAERQGWIRILDDTDYVA